MNTKIPWKVNTIDEKKAKRMLQIDWEIFHVIPVEETSFHPPYGIVIALDPCLHNSSVNSFRMVAFWIPNILMDLGVTPTNRLFYHFFIFMGSGCGYYQNIQLSYVRV